MNYSLAFGIVAGVLVFFLAILFFLSFFFPIIPNPLGFFREASETETEKIERQIEELDMLRQQSDIKEPTEENIKTQQEEIESFREEGQSKPEPQNQLSPEELQRQQLDELGKLRQSTPSN